jgi:hypothetical protein
VLAELTPRAEAGLEWSDMVDYSSCCRQIAWLDPIRIEDIAKTGDRMKKQLVGEYGLLSRNEAASGVIADLS